MHGAYMNCPLCRVNRIGVWPSVPGRPGRVWPRMAAHGAAPEDRGVRRVTAYEMPLNRLDRPRRTSTELPWTRCPVSGRRTEAIAGVDEQLLSKVLTPFPQNIRV